MVETEGDALDHKFKWFDDWNSWGMYSEDKSRVVH